MAVIARLRCSCTIVYTPLRTSLASCHLLGADVRILTKHLWATHEARPVSKPSPSYSRCLAPQRYSRSLPVSKLTGNLHGATHDALLRSILKLVKQRVTRASFTPSKHHPRSLHRATHRSSSRENSQEECFEA